MIYFGDKQVTAITINGKSVARVSFGGVEGFPTTVGSKPTDASAVYTGSVITNGYTKPDHVSVTGNTSGTNAGTYKATYTPDSGYSWNDGTTASVEVVLTITKISVAIPTISGTSKTYNGADQSVTVSGVDATKVTYSGETSKDAGEKVVTFVLKDATNTEWSDGTSADKTASWTIARATIDTFTLNGTAKAYTGSEVSVGASSVKAGTLAATYEASGTWRATAVGDYTATVTGTGNFQGSQSVSWSLDYYWNKYNVATVYAEASRLCSTQYYSPWGADLTAYVKYWYTGDGQPVLNTSTGQYDISGYPNTRRIDDNFTTRGFCCSKNTYAGDTTPEYVWTTGANSYGWCLYNAKVCVAMNGSTSAYLYYTTSSETRGTYISQVTSRSSSAYPENAKHTDGYWYTKTW